MSSLDLNYLAAVLKFFAVPAAVFELIAKEYRDRIESWLVEKLPKLLKSFGITFVILYILVVLLVKLGPFLVILYLLFINLITKIITDIITSETGWNPIGTALVIGCGLFLGFIVAAIFEKWILPESWILTIAYPFEAFSVWANSNSYVDLVLPDYSGERFLEYYRQVFLAIENFLWSWLAIVYRIYFFLARGLMLLMVILIQISFFLSTLFLLLFSFWLPLFLFIRFSDFVKRTFRIARDRIPVGAFILWATGETLEFILKTLEQLQKCD